VGDLYGDLDAHGATVLATPFSRIFVDVNRRRRRLRASATARSAPGAAWYGTHTMREVPIFRQPAGAHSTSRSRLQALYDPYYSTLERLLDEIRGVYGYALLLDGHTGSPRRYEDHQVIIGTRHETTCAPRSSATVASIFARGRLRGAPERQRLRRRLTS
jgi:N-formylglutamate amidohydrolase